MKNNIDNFMKNKLSVDNLNLETPDISLVNEARLKIMVRKKAAAEKESFYDLIFNFFHFQLKPYQAGIAALLIAAGIFYFINNQTSKTESGLLSKNATTNYTISTSTVLASLTQYTNNKTATSSSTVLTSIITFVVRN